jgi:hypothetical protein
MIARTKLSTEPSRSPVLVRSHGRPRPPTGASQRSQQLPSMGENQVVHVWREAGCSCCHCARPSQLKAGQRSHQFILPGKQSQAKQRSVPFAGLDPRSTNGSRCVTRRVLVYTRGGRGLDLPRRRGQQWEPLPTICSQLPSPWPARRKVSHNWTYCIGSCCLVWIRDDKAVNPPS